MGKNVVATLNKGASVLLIHSMLLSERERIETIEKQMLFQQKQWNDVWAEAHSEEVSKYKEDAFKMQQQIAELRAGDAARAEQIISAPEPEAESVSKSPVDVEAILRDNFAKNPNEGLAPDYHDASMEKVFFICILGFVSLLLTRTETRSKCRHIFRLNREKPPRFSGSG